MFLKDIMGRKICVVCGSGISSKCHITYHRFPSDVSRMKRWCDSLQLNIEGLSKFSYICSIHFASTDIMKTAKRTYIKPNAIPFVSNGRIQSLPSQKNTARGLKKDLQIALSEDESWQLRSVPLVQLDSNGKMPISEDEFEYNSQQPQSTMSKAELRKTHKPIMEKRRRARINQCLNEIKTLILEAMNKDPSRHSKLEKADILEMAVKHLQNVQRQQLAMAMATDPSVLRKFKTGFNECASEIDRYMGQIDEVDSSMKQRVSSHLMKCIGGIEQVAQFNFPGFSNAPFLNDNNPFTTATTAEAVTGDQNNNARIQIPQGIHLIPSRLPNGELALLVPNSSKLPYFPTAVTATIQRPSAFATVVPQSTSSETSISKPLSPPMSPDMLRARNPSPHGFRPVLSSKKNYGEDHQVPQISSTVTSDHHKFSQPLEVKTLRYPIQKKLDSPKGTGEPLCIITNQAERFRQAQTREESSNYSENVVQSVKRKADGLLAIAPPPKIIKTQLVTPTTSFARDVDALEPLRHPLRSETYDRHVPDRRNEPSVSREGNADGGNDMWRPW